MVAQLRQISNEELREIKARREREDYERRNAPYSKATALLDGRTGSVSVVERGGVHSSYIMGYDDESVVQLKALALDPERKWDSQRGPAMHALGIIGSVDPATVSFDDYLQLVLTLENGPQFQERSLGLLPRIYMGVTHYYPDQRVFEFLADRADGSFWDGNPPSYTYAVEGISFTESGQSMALQKLAALDDPRVEPFLEEIEASTPPEREEIHLAIDVGRDSRNMYRRLRGARDQSYQIRLSREQAAQDEINQPFTPDSPTPEPEDATEAASGHPIKLPDASPAEPTTTLDTPAPQSSERNTPFLWLGLGIIILLLGAFAFLKRKPR